MGAQAGVDQGRAGRRGQGRAGGQGRVGQSRAARGKTESHTRKADHYSLQGETQPALSTCEQCKTENGQLQQLVMHLKLETNSRKIRETGVWV